MKELRLRGISTPEVDNAYLREFRADYNERFAREPLSRHDAHRPVRNDEDLDRIFTWQEERKLSRNLTVSRTLTLRQKARLRAAPQRADASAS